VELKKGGIAGLEPGTLLTLLRPRHPPPPPPQ
jgi:hypothetical protein